MDHPSRTDEKTDFAEARHKSQNIYYRGSKSTKKTSLNVDKPTQANEKRNYADVKAESTTWMSSNVERRPSLHSFDTALPQENSHCELQSNLYIAKAENASVSAMKFPVRSPSLEQAVSSEKPNVKTYDTWAILVVVFAVILGVLTILVAFDLSAWRILSPDKDITTSEEKIGKDSPLEHLRERFHDLRLLFPSQTGRLWTVSLAAIRSLLERPKHPAVILLAGSKQITATTDCVALRLSEEVKDALEAEAPVVVFDCRRYNDWEPHEVKREMDEKLTEAFENGAKVGVVLGVESLPGMSPMIFYRFCDTANAPFKNIVLILTLNMEHEATSDHDSEAHEEMSRLWSPVMDPEQVDPLFSRIGNSVAYVSEETDHSHCPKMD